VSEEGYRRQQRRRRISIWLAILVAILFDNIIVAPNPLPRPDYVPTIANGLVASTSILMALAFFSLTHCHTTIKDNDKRWHYHALAMLYLLMLFSVLVLGVMIGYRFVLTNELGYAFSCFMTQFIIMCGIIVDIWIVSEQFYFR